MAKYFEEFLDSNETQYASGNFPIMAFAKLNEGVKYSKLQPSGTDTENTGMQVAIQRMKRLKSVDVTKTDKGGTDAIALFDSADKVKWDTVETKTGEKKSILVRLNKNIEHDVLADATPYTRTIANKNKNRMFEAEEMATAKVFAAGTLSGSKLIVDGTKDKEIVEAIEAAALAIELKVDDFKAYSDPIIVVHPLVAAAFAKVEGQSYSQGTNTFPQGAGQSFTYNAREYFVSKILNTIEGAAPTEVAGAIVMDKESYANAGQEFGYNEIDQVFGDERFVGHVYFGMDSIIDSARISTFEMTLPTGITKTAKVND